MAETNTYYMDGLGVKRAKTDIPIDVNTVFRIGSLSKGLTASLTGILVDKGVLSWENRLKNLLPMFELKDSRDICLPKCRI